MRHAFAAPEHSLTAGPRRKPSLYEGETSNSGEPRDERTWNRQSQRGLINANVVGLFLLVDPNATSGLTNTGIMQASAGGLLRLTGNGGGDFNNSGGLIQALDGSEVQLTAGATINGGRSRPWAAALFAILAPPL